MVDFGITSAGFKRKNLSVIVEEGLSELNTAFGGNMNLDASNPDVQVNAALSESLSLLWEIAAICYNSLAPSGATDDALTKLVQLNYISRQQATPSTVTLTLFGSPGTVVSAGSLVTSGNGAATFATDFTTTIELGAQVNVTATNVETGPIVATAGSLTVIESQSATPGWISVNNAVDAVIGRDLETDPDLRARRASSVGLAGNSHLDSIFAVVADAPGVSSVTIIENDESIEVAGQPPNSIAVTVSGGADQDIIDAIGAKHTPGVGTAGDVAGVYTDSEGRTHTVRFSRPSTVSIFVTVTLNRFADYPADGDETIKTNVAAFINGLNNGDDVILSNLYTPINATGSQSVLDLRIGTTASPTGEIDISVASSSKATTTETNIVVL